MESAKDILNHRMEGLEKMGISIFLDKLFANTPSFIEGQNKNDKIQEIKEKICTLFPVELASEVESPLFAKIAIFFLCAKIIENLLKNITFSESVDVVELKQKIAMEMADAPFEKLLTFIDVARNLRNVSEAV